MCPNRVEGVIKSSELVGSGYRGLFCWGMGKIEHKKQIQKLIFLGIFINTVLKGLYIYNTTRHTTYIVLDIE